MSARTLAAAASRAPAVSGAAPARPSLSSVRAPVLQRACACGAVPGRGGKCADCEDKDKKRPMQRATDGGGAAPSAIPASVSRTVQSPGQALDTGTRAAMEPRFGRDFSDVRVHTDTEAAESARAVNARAYTVGQDIAFASGQYQPSTDEGSALLAHELAHTVQQSGFHRAVRDGSPIVASENNALEHEAASAAMAVTTGAPVGALSVAPAPAISCAPWGECPSGSKEKLNEEFGKELKKRDVPGAKTKEGKKILKSKKPGYFTHQASVVAEDRIAGYFKQQRGRWAHINKDEVQPTQGADPEREPNQYMVNLAYDLFRSGGSGKRKGKGTKPSTKEEEDKTPTAYPSEKPALNDEGDVADTGGPAPSGTRYRPDCLDFAQSEIYDVTTIDAAKGKVEKLEQYRGDLEGIRTKNLIGVAQWSIGKSLEPPPRLTFGLQNDSDPIKICFGVTDFTTYAGVLAYEVIDTGDADGAETDTGEGAVERADYPISFGGAKGILRVPVTFAENKKEVVPIEDDSEHGATATMIKGLVLTELRHKTQTKISPDVILARIDSTGLKLKLDKKAKSVLFNVGSDGTLTLDPASKKIKGLPFDFENLSAGQITSIEPNETGGIDWTGTINASIPLLGKLDVIYKNNELAIKKDLGPKDLKAPFPGVRVKEASLSLKLAPDFVPQGDSALVFGPADKPLAEAALKASTDGKGFVVAGQLKVFIPGVDKAEANVAYKGGGEYGAGNWTGTITSRARRSNCRTSRAAASSCSSHRARASSSTAS